MRHIALLLLCLLPVPLLHSEDRSVTVDGVFWNSLKPVEQLRFLMGFVNGYQNGEREIADQAEAHNLVGTAALARLRNDHYDPAPLTFGQLKQGLDKCYSDYRNLQLPMNDCVRWTVMGVKGDSDKERDDYLQLARIIQSK
jgi:hypothetical protein